MKLLFDHNLPPSLVRRLANLFPLSVHVYTVGLDRASDLEIREFAQVEGFTIVTKEADFSDLCVVRGFPPKIIWIRRGNCTVDDLEQLLSDQYEQIEALYGDPSIGVLTLF